FTYSTGNISITTSAGDLIDSTAGSAGIFATNVAAAVPNTSQISVTAYGTINSGSATLFGGSAAPAGILAGYQTSGSNVANPNLHGNVVIDDFASITAPAGTDGIRGYNFGTGNILITAEAGATISAGRNGLQAFAPGGGNAHIVNNATV